MWYTVETMRLRREAEARAKRDREPRISFEVEQTNKMLQFSYDKYPLRVNLVNHSPNAALARVRIRLKIGSQGDVLLPNRAYSGSQIWEITPFFQLSGWFDLKTIAKHADQGTDDMRLNVQVDLYWPDRRHFDTLKKEYTIRVRQQDNLVVFWQEIATSLPVLECPDELP